jgi:hypothetical protein
MEIVSPVRDGVGTARALCDWMDKNAIVYWIDSGTLLGLIREGRLPHDDDFDIGLVASDRDVDQLAESCSKLASDVSIFLSDGRVSKIKIRSIDGLAIDLNVFQEHCGMFVSPQRVRPPLWYWFPDGLRGAVAAILGVSRPTRSGRRIHLEGRKRTYQLWAWVVPKRFIGRPRKCPETGWQVPEYSEAYLTFRYGNWRVPHVGSWRFSRDDRGISPLSPAIMRRLARLAYSPGVPVA